MSDYNWHVFASCTECDFEVGRKQETAFKVETSSVFQEASREALSHSKGTGHSIVYGEDES